MLLGEEFIKHGQEVKRSGYVTIGQTIAARQYEEVLGRKSEDDLCILFETIMAATEKRQELQEENVKIMEQYFDKLRKTPFITLPGLPAAPRQARAEIEAVDQNIVRGRAQSCPF